MKLEHKFFNSFFYPFLIGVVLNMIVVTIFLFIFTNNYYDKRTAKNIVDLEKKFSKININSINTLVATTLLKVQASLNEQIIIYQKLARKTDEIINYELNNFLKCLLDIDDEYLEQNLETLKYKGFWFLDNVTREDNLISNDTIKLQLISYSNILQNVFSTLAATKSSVEAYSFYFEETNLVINFPLDYYYKNKYLEIFTKYTVNPPWCLDSKGKPLTIYNMKCRDIYNMIIKAKSDVFDLNYSDENNRTIFITNSYQQLGIAGNSSNTVFSLIIQFDDPISGGLGYAIADINQDDLLFALDNFRKDYADQCTLKDYTQETVKLFNYYFSLDTIDNYQLYQDNNIISTINNSKLVKYGYDISKYKNNKLHLYVRTHYGYDKECLEKRKKNMIL